MNAWFWKERLTTQRRLQEGQLDGPQAYAIIFVPAVLLVSAVAPPAIFVMGAACAIVFITIFALKCTCSVFTAERELNATEVTATLPISAWRQVVGRWAGASLPAFSCWCVCLIFVAPLAIGGLGAIVAGLAVWWLFGVWLCVVTAAGIFSSMTLPKSMRVATAAVALLCVLAFLDNVRKSLTHSEADRVLIVVSLTAAGAWLTSVLLLASSLGAGHHRNLMQPQATKWLNLRRPADVLMMRWRTNPIFSAYLRGQKPAITVTNFAAIVIAAVTLISTLMVSPDRNDLTALTVGLPLVWGVTLIEALLFGTHWIDRERSQNRWDGLVATGIRPRTIATGILTSAVNAQSVEWIVPLPLWIALALNGHPLCLMLIALQPALTLVGATLGLTGGLLRPSPGYDPAGARAASGILITVAAISTCWVIRVLPITDISWSLALPAALLAACASPWGVRSLCDTATSQIADKMQP